IRPPSTINDRTLMSQCRVTPAFSAVATSASMRRFPAKFGPGGRCPRAAGRAREAKGCARSPIQDRKSTRLNSSHVSISYAGCCPRLPGLPALPPRRSSDLDPAALDDQRPHLDVAVQGDARLLRGGHERVHEEVPGKVRARGPVPAGGGPRAGGEGLRPLTHP